MQSAAGSWNNTEREVLRVDEATTVEVKKCPRGSRETDELGHFSKSAFE